MYEEPISIHWTEDKGVGERLDIPGDKGRQTKADGREHEGQA